MGWLWPWLQMKISGSAIFPWYHWQVYQNRTKYLLISQYLISVFRGIPSGGRSTSWGNHGGDGSRISQRNSYSRQGPADLLFCKNFAKNCMKMKEFGPRGRNARPWCPFGSATTWMGDYCTFLSFLSLSMKDSTSSTWGRADSISSSILFLRIGFSCKHKKGDRFINKLYLIWWENRIWRSLKSVMGSYSDKTAFQSLFTQKSKMLASNQQDSKF